MISSNSSLTEDMYWINVKDAIFGAVIEHTNFMPIEDYGEHLMYLAAYSLPNDKLYNLPDHQIKKLFLKDLIPILVKIQQ